MGPWHSSRPWFLPRASSISSSRPASSGKSSGPSSVSSSAAFCAATESSDARHGEHVPSFRAEAGQNAGPPSGAVLLSQ